MVKEEKGFLPAKAQPAAPVVELETQSAASAAAAKAEVEAAYLVAINRPRDMNTVRVRILDACRRTKFAQAALYSKPVGGRDITGLSVRAAEEVIRNMGNIRVSTVTTFEDDIQRKVKVTVTDLEVNSAYTQEITVKKTVERRNGKDREVLGTRTNTQGQPVYIVKATDDEMMQKESALVSKVLRNESLRLTPSDLLEEVMELVKETLSSDASQDPKAQLKAIMDAFHGLGVEPADLSAYLGHDVAKVTPMELTKLREVYTTINDGQAVWSDYVEDVEGNGKKKTKAKRPNTGNGTSD